MKVSHRKECQEQFESIQFMITINRLQQQRGESAFLFFFFPLGFSSREAFLFTNKFSFIYNFFFIFVQIIKLNIFTQ